MPIYTYKCKAEHTVTVTHSITTDPKIKCSNCGGGMKRVPQAAATQFKGSGFYSTDKNK